MVHITHRIGIKAPAAQVYEAVATAQGVGGWWTRDTTSSGAEGERLKARFLTKDGQEIGAMQFEMITRAPNSEVRWRFSEGPPDWIGTDATFELVQEGEMTILNFGHRNWKEQTESMAHCSMKWAVFLMSLREYVETGSGKPSPLDVKIDNWN